MCPTWLPVELSRLGRRADELSPGGLRDRPWPSCRRRGAARLPPRRSVRQAPSAHGRMGGLLRKARGRRRRTADGAAPMNRTVGDSVSQLIEEFRESGIFLPAELGRGGYRIIEDALWMVHQHVECAVRNKTKHGPHYLPIANRYFGDLKKIAYLI